MLECPVSANVIGTTDPTERCLDVAVFVSMSICPAANAEVP